MRRPFVVLACVAGLAACESTPYLTSPDAPAFAEAGETTGLIPGKYIVTLSDEVDALPVALEYGIQPDYVYDDVLTGFAGSISDVVLEALKLDARVLMVEQDGVITTSETQSPVTWGLDRIDQRALPLSGSYTYPFTGAGVTAYIVDTGIRYDHQDFEGRASFGYDVMPDSATQKGADCQGHGTHVAGTVGGKTYGVAKAVNLVSVRVLGCTGSGSFSGIIKAMDWIAANGTLPAVANMSIGSLIPQRSATVDAATANLVASGVTVVYAAGNGVPNGGVAIDACNNAPGGHPESITVGASDQSDTKTVWSNYGDCVTLFAPGRSITSTDYSGPTATSTKSGTSMASPHAAGVAALYLEQAPRAAPATVKAALAEASTKNVVQLSLTTDNHLLYSQVVAPQPAPDETGPTPCTPKNRKKQKCK